MKKMSLLSLVLVVIATVALTGCGVNFSNGTGSKVGQVVKLSKQGFSSKTWEAQLIRGGLNGGSGAFGTAPFDFTIESDEVAKQVQEYMDNQTEVVITYRLEGIYSISRSESGGHFLDSIRPATNSVTKASAARQ